MIQKVVLFDLGDTLMIEESELKDESLTTLKAELIPGMKAVVMELYNLAIPCGIVADTRPGTCRNVLSQHDMANCFSTLTISEELGVEKPHSTMFKDALKKHHLSVDQAHNALMIGNNYERDILGAKACGLQTVWFQWNERYDMPDDATAADFVCHTPAEIRSAVHTWLQSGG